MASGQLITVERWTCRVTVGADAKACRADANDAGCARGTIGRTNQSTARGARVRIDVVSDIACPWCAIGVSALERAIERIGTEIGPIEVYLQPFELNPQMPPEGADATEYLQAKFGMSPEQLAVNRARIAERGAAEGFTFGTRAHVWNTFDAHRLLAWAPSKGRRRAAGAEA